MRALPWLASFLALGALACAPPNDGGPVRPPAVSSPTPNPTPVDRAQEIVSEIEDQNAWLPEDLRQEKYCKIAKNPFRFYRGTNHLFWWDFAADARLATFGSETTRSWIQADLHIENFGAFSNDTGAIVYDLNDFDEGVVADVQLDVWRLATSIELAALTETNLPRHLRHRLIRAMSESYLQTMASVAADPGLLNPPVDSESAGALGTFIADVAASRSRLDLLEKWTLIEEGVPSFDFEYSKLAAATPELEGALLGAWPDYTATLSGNLPPRPEYFEILSVAQRLKSGTGSYGTPRYYVLIEGPTPALEDNRILDVKLQRDPSPHRFLDGAGQTVLDDTFANPAERVALAQHAMGRSVDDHLGWIVVNGDAYSVREKLPFDESIEFGDLTLDEMTEMAGHWGRVAAIAHARGDQDFDPGLVPHSIEHGVTEAVGGDEKAWSDLIVEVAWAYGNQAVTDYVRFAEWLAAKTPGC